METTLDLANIFEQDTFDQESFAALRQLAFANTESINRFGELLADLERKTEAGEVDPAKGTLKLGMCYLISGKSSTACDWLSKAVDCADTSTYLGLALREQRRYRESSEQFARAEQHGADKIECGCRRAENLLLLGEVEEAQTILDQCSAGGEEAAIWHYAQARSWQGKGDLDQAIASYDRALDIDPDHPDSIFHLACLLHIHGNDAEAQELFEMAACLPFVHMNALINLAILYEDLGSYRAAEVCLRRVLAVDPTHPRAQLYLKDVLAANDMYIDEQRRRDAEVRNAVLDIPVSDFELSVRSRNCLKKMNIHTLGDLLRTSEAELLSYKNFGETSLKEIKAMLKQKGLGLGQNLNQTGAIDAPATAGPPADMDIEPGLAMRPVSSMELSVRSRKCLQVLGIATIGELVGRTENELLSSRNFGRTSLEEITNCLTQLGLTLAERK